MIQVQNPAISAPSHLEACQRTDPHISISYTSNGLKIPVTHQPIPGNFVLKNLQVTPPIVKSAVEPAKSRGDSDTERKEAHARWASAYTSQLLKRSRRMMGPANLAQRKSAADVLVDYTSTLQKKKDAVLSLAALEIECEECEAVLIEAYGGARLKEILAAHYVTDDPSSATGQYFDAVSAIRFDPLDL